VSEVSGVAFAVFALRGPWRLEGLVLAGVLLTRNGLRLPIQILLGLYSITIYEFGGNCWTTSTMVSVGSYSTTPCICFRELQLNGQTSHLLCVYMSEFTVN
jgi:hypothetical protein